MCLAVPGKVAESFEELAQNGPRPALPVLELLSCMAPRSRGLCASEGVTQNGVRRETVPDWSGVYFNGGEHVFRAIRYNS